MPGFTVLAVPTSSTPGRAARASPRRCRCSWRRPRPGSTDDDLRLVPVELGLGGAHRLGEVVVIQGGVDDLVAVLRQVRRLDAAGGECQP